MPLKLAVSVFVMGYLISCKERQAAVAGEVAVPDDFIPFYEKFHVDSIFQIDHIIFPLAGIPAEDSLRSDDWVWQKEEWHMHHPFNDQGGSFQRSWFNVNQVLVEKISDASGRFSMERRWARIDGEWNLIYYKEMGW